MERQFAIGVVSLFSSFVPSLPTLMAAVCLIVATPSADAARPTQADLTRSALKSEIGPSDDAKIEQRVRAAKDRVAARSREQPAVVGYAVAIFNTGVTESELQRFAESYGVEISRVEAKIPVNDDGIVFTVSFGSRDILMRPGTFSEQLRGAMAHQRGEFHAMAQISADESEKHRFLTAAFALPILYYKIECVGQNAALASIDADSKIAAVFPREGSAEVTSYLAFKEMYAAARRDAPPPIRVIGRLERPPLDPKIDPNTPVLTRP